MTLLALLREDWVAHDRDWTRPGFRALVVARLGPLQFRVPGWAHRMVKRAHLVLYRFVRNHYGIELPYTVEIGRRVVFEHQGQIVIHGWAVIGDDCVIRQGVTLGNRHRDRPRDAPRLGNGVEVGAGAAVLGAVTVGDGVRIGANAVVLDDLPPGCTAVGVPATVRPSP